VDKTTPRRLLVAACAALVALAALGPAREARSAPCSASVDESRRHMERGFALYDRKQFPDAAAEFDAAYRAQPFSAFLCNAAMAYQEALDFPNAILRYKAFLAAEPNPPDLPRLKTMLAWLEAQLAAQIAARQAGATVEADGGLAADRGAPAPAGEPPPPPVQMSHSFRSQVIVISDPPEAPLTVYARHPGAPPFVTGAANPGWERVASGVRTPHDLSLAAGGYHIVIDAFKDYKRSETDLELLPGRLYEFKANLSQGEFMGFLRVLSPAPGARVYLDDPPPHRKPPWGRAPHGALVESGEHAVWVEAPGYEPASEKVVLDHGTTVEISPALARVAHGWLRVDGNAEEVTVKVDGVPRGLYTPLGEPLRLQLTGGKHALALEAEGRKTYAGDVDVPRGQVLGVHGRLSFKPSRSSAVVTGALAVGAVVGGVVLFRQAAQPQPAPAPGMAPTSAPTYLRIGGGASFGVGGLLAFSTVYALARDPTPPSRVQLDKPRDLDADEAEPPSPAAPSPRVLGTEASSTQRRCDTL
jgi:PEGA domain